MAGRETGKTLIRLTWRDLFDMHDRKFQLALVLVALTTFYIIWWRLKGRRRLPPGPRSWPFVGNMFEMERPKAIFEIFTELSKKYGDIFTFRMGPVSYVVLNSTEVIHEAFVEKAAYTSSRPQTVSTSVFKERLEPILMGQHDRVVKLQRRIMHRAMSEFVSGGLMEELLRSRVAHTIDLIQTRKDSPVSCFEYPTLLSYNCVIAMMFGQILKMEDPLFGQLVEMLDEVISVFGAGMLADTYPILAYIPHASLKNYRATMHRFSDHLCKSLSDHREKYNPEKPCDYVCHLLLAEKAAREDPDEDKEALALLDDKHLAGTLADIFFAGTEPLRLMLLWILSLCAQYPDVQRKMHKELDDVLGEEGVLTFAHRSKLPYIEAVVNETLRMYPPIPLAVPHVTNADVTIGDFVLRKGTFLLPNVWALHRDGAVWKYPAVFSPDRWLDKEGKLIASPPQFMPFSTGVRACPATSLVKTQLHFLTASLLQKTVFKPPPSVGTNFRLRVFPAGFVCMPRPHFVVAAVRGRKWSSEKDQDQSCKNL